jgi:hypothetical protein
MALAAAQRSASGMPGAQPAPGIPEISPFVLRLAAARRMIAKAFILAKANYRISV